LISDLKWQYKLNICAYIIKEAIMNRDNMLKVVKDTTEIWDFIIIGAGATGLGVAVDAASRGYRTLLLEQGDFAQGTSSRSTKLIHGGVRYLQQGNVSLVLEALRERGLLRQNAPHLFGNLPFIVPNYAWWEGPFYGIGLRTGSACGCMICSPENWAWVSPKTSPGKKFWNVFPP
jgi:glycerol-3-phosphate dehydrogenase